MTESIANPMSEVEITMQQVKRGRLEMEADDQPNQPNENDDIRTLLMAVWKKIDALNVTMSGNDKRINTKIDNLETALSNKIKEVKEEVEKRVQEATNELDKRLESSSLNTKKMCEEITTSAVDALTQRVDELQAYNESRVDKLERFSLEKDLIISGVPLENNDDPIAILGDICGVLNCNLKQSDFVSAYRLSSKTNTSKNTRIQPIAVRTQDDWVKRELLTAYFKKANLNLTDIGFKTRARIYINERLTATNREIFNRAAEAKKTTSFTVSLLDGVSYISNVLKTPIPHVLPTSANWTQYSHRTTIDIITVMVAVMVFVVVRLKIIHHHRLTMKRRRAHVRSRIRTNRLVSCNHPLTSPLRLGKIRKR